MMSSCAGVPGMGTKFEKLKSKARPGWSQNTRSRHPRSPDRVTSWRTPGPQNVKVARRAFGPTGMALSVPKMSNDME